MSPLDLLPFGPVTLSIEMLGGLLIAAYCLAAVIALLRGRGILAARERVAEGALLGLSWKLAATLLKTVALHTWAQIGGFVAILVLRTLLKRIFLWEQERFKRSLP